MLQKQARTPIPEEKTNNFRQPNSVQKNVGNSRTTQFFYDQLIEGKRKPNPGDVIFSRNATVGASAQVTENHPPFAMGQDVCLLSKRNKEFSTEWLLFLMRSGLVQTQLVNMMIGSTFKRINVEEIRNIVLTCPPVFEQHEISQYLSNETSKIDILIKKADQSIELMKERL